MYGRQLKKCYGVEIIPELYESSVTVLDQLDKHVYCESRSIVIKGCSLDLSNLYADHRQCEMKVSLGDFLAVECIDEWAAAGEQGISCVKL